MATTAVAVVEGSLSTDEKRELAQHEEVIKRYAEAYADVGESLLAIRDHRLYRVTHKTFESYCVERLGFTKTHANHLIASVAVVRNLTSIDVKPKNLAQTRPLARLAPDQQQQAWTVAQERAAGKEITAFDLEQAAAKVAPKVAARPIETPEQKKERVARLKKNQERREKEAKRKAEIEEKKQREAWERNIVAVRSPIKSWGGSRPAGRNLESAITAAIGQGEIEGDVALFQGGRLLAVVTWKNGRPMIAQRAEIEQDSKVG
jgi:hypothetical protein